MKSHRLGARPRPTLCRRPPGDEGGEGVLAVDVRGLEKSVFVGVSTCTQSPHPEEAEEDEESEEKLASLAALDTLETLHTLSVRRWAMPGWLGAVSGRLVGLVVATKTETFQNVECIVPELDVPRMDSHLAHISALSIAARNIARYHEWPSAVREGGMNTAGGLA